MKTSKRNSSGEANKSTITPVASAVNGGRIWDALTHGENHRIVMDAVGELKIALAAEPVGNSDIPSELFGNSG